MLDVYNKANVGQTVKFLDYDFIDKIFYHTKLPITCDSNT